MKKHTIRLVFAIATTLSLTFNLSACTSTPAQTGQETETGNSENELLLEARQREYAKLIVESGLGLKEGQNVLISAEAECYEFARMCVEAAYAAGAGNVILNWRDTPSNVQQYMYADDSAFEEYPSYKDELYRVAYEEKYAIISLSSKYPDIMEQVPDEMLERTNVTSGENYKKYDLELNNCVIPWVLAGVPNEVWAQKVFPETSALEAEEKLWDAILDTAYVSGNGDSLEVWDEHINELNSRAAILNEQKIKSLHYTNSLGTDLTIELPENAVWCTTEATTPDGTRFSVNIPSEEVFTSPLKQSANGTIYSSMPLELNGTVVRDIKFTVKDGKIVEADASEGLEALNLCLDSDENARYFGEISLVPYDSPISQSGILFYNTLYDENASCHIAFGCGFGRCLESGSNMTQEELEAAGLNTSDVHRDFMIGTSDLKIVATTYDGKEIVLFENGNFSNIKGV